MLRWARRPSCSSGKVKTCREADHRERPGDDQATRTHQTRSRAGGAAVSSRVSRQHTYVHTRAWASGRPRGARTAPSRRRRMGRRESSALDRLRSAGRRVARSQSSEGREARRSASVALEDGGAGGRLVRGDRAPDLLPGIRMVRDRLDAPDHAVGARRPVAGAGIELVSEEEVRCERSRPA